MTKDTHQYLRSTRPPAQTISGSDYLRINPQHEYDLMVCTCCGETFVGEIEATPAWMSEGNPNAISEDLAYLGVVCGQCLISPLVAARRALRAAHRIEGLAHAAKLRLDMDEYNRLTHVELGYRDIADRLQQHAAAFQDWPLVEHDPGQLDRLFGEQPGEWPGYP